MRKLLLIILLAPISFFGQESENTKKVNYKNIDIEVNNSKSEYYYPKLKQRLIALDSTLTTNDLHYLYYGTSLQKDFSVMERATHDPKMLAYFNQESISQDQWKDIEKHYTDLFNSKPFLDIETFDILLGVFQNTNQKDKFDKLDNILQKFFNMWLETGNGLTKETAIDVISTTHEYYFMRVINLKVSGQALLHDEAGRSYDLLKVEKEENSDSKNEEKQITGVYFDVTRIFELYNETFTKN
ncbi:protein of unknown function [Paenimyroides ummariense]|uniref:DUF4919 domain-containing protein n=1 Tax=Paenimyroides ummariense TaxID=913024 RepID=A0A1I5FUC6_9FLAO|nr:DUF4919 domain-containing protein [Paenimyroides ummariense]SFO27404.1 protein of unknown function [Paenimyroides ummariense]